MTYEENLYVLKFGTGKKLDEYSSIFLQSLSYETTDIYNYERPYFIKNVFAKYITFVEKQFMGKIPGIVDFLEQRISITKVIISWIVA